MVIFNDAEIDTMLGDWGHSLTAGAVTHPCLFDQRDEIGLEHEGGAGQLLRIIVAIVKTSHFPGLQGGDPVTVDGIAYTIWRRLLLGDGGLTELSLRVP